MGSPTSWRTWSSTQSVKYCARWLASTGFTRTLVAKASSRWAGVMKCCSTISSSTMVARRAARSVAATGE